MALQVPQLLNTLAPDVQQHALSHDKFHHFSFFEAAWPYVKHQLFQSFLVLMSLFLRAGSLLHKTCVVLAIITMVTLEMGVNAKVLKICLYGLFLFCRYLPVSWLVSGHEERIKSAFARRLVYSATLGVLLEFVIQAIIQTVVQCTAQCIHLLVQLFKLAEELETAWSNGDVDSGETKSRIDLCIQDSMRFANTEPWNSARYCISNAVAFSIVPIVLISGYKNVGQSSEMILKWAFVTGIGTQISDRLFGLLSKYHPPLPEGSSLLHVCANLLVVIRMVMVEVAAYMYVGGVKAGVNTYFKCISWAGVMWYLFSFKMASGVLIWAQSKLVDHERKTKIRGMLCMALASLSWVVDVAFVASTFSSV